MSWTHLRDENVRAKKQKRCYLCGLFIEKHERHIVRTGVDADGIISFAMHIGCNIVANEKYDEDSWECHDEYEFRREYLGIEL